MKIIKIQKKPSTTFTVEPISLLNTHRTPSLSRWYFSSKCKSGAGFTLIEIIVSIGIFSTVMLIGVGALLSVNDANRKARALRVVMDNINFAVEDMARKIRIGDEFLCTTDVDEINSNVRGDCPSGGDKLIFKFKKTRNASDAPVSVMYYIQNSNDKQWIANQLLERRGQRFAIKSDQDSLIDPDEVFPSFMTSPEEIYIEELKFFVVGSEDPNKQPRVTIVVSGIVNLLSEKLSTDFSIQTTVSQRKAGGN